MRRQTVKARIFKSNALMVITVLLIFLCINTFVLKRHLPGKNSYYSSGTENEIGVTDEMTTKWGYEYDSNLFILLFVLDGVICIAALLGVSLIFTNRMTKRILEPLEKLNDGSERVRSGNLTEDIEYSGEVEFENVCHTFNEMQHDILIEREQLQKYEKARTDMIAGISHDLRTPLTAVRGTVKGMMDGVAATPEMQQKFLETAYRRTEEMEVLLKQLFFFSAMETGKLPLQLADFSLNHYVEKYICEKQADIGLSDIHFSVYPSEKDLTISADPEQLQRILDNLLENSLKYAGIPDLHISIKVYREKRRAMLQFSDNGEGVSQAVMEHMFEEFYRGDASRNQQKGNGLGLYIIKYLMEAMNGSVWAENRNGLLITLSFPLKGVTHSYERNKKDSDC